jgi:hypothetical protein
MLKKIFALVAILLVLIIVNFAIRSRRVPQDIVEQANLMRLTPSELVADDVKRLEFYPGGKPDEKVVLTRGDEDAWVVTSRFGAPVREEKINEYLRDLTRLRGEFRAAAEDDVALEPYGLGDGEAFHVVAYAAEEPLFHLLVGEAPQPRTVFMRQEGSRDVYVEAINLRSSAGVFGEDTSGAVDTKAWIDTTVIDLEPDAITRIALEMPDKHVVLEKREKQMAEIVPPEGEEAEAPEQEKVYEWLVAEGGPGAPVNQPGLDSLLRKLDAFQATDVADPAKLAELGLDHPVYRMTVGLEGVEAPVELVGARTEDGKGYIQLAGEGASSLVYEVNTYSFEQVFPQGATLFELPSLSLGAQDLQKIDIQRADNPITLQRDGDNWQVTVPAAELDVQAPVIESMATALGNWRPADYADADKVAELAFDKSVTFATADEIHTLAVDGPSGHIDGAYVRLDEGETIYAMNQMDLDRIFVAPSQLYNLALFDVAEEDIESIAVNAGENAFTLTRAEEGAWVLTLNGEETPADQSAAERLALAIVDLQANDILFVPIANNATSAGELSFTTADGDEYSLSLGPPREDGMRPAVREGLDKAVVLTAEDAEVLLAPAETYRPMPEPEVAVEGEAVAPEAPAEGPLIAPDAAPEVVVAE